MDAIRRGDLIVPIESTRAKNGIKVSAGFRVSGTRNVKLLERSLGVNSFLLEGKQFPELPKKEMGREKEQ